jgi:hypothetical protein
MIFGDTPEHGKGLVDFINNNYTVSYHFGDSPIDPSKRGVAIFSRKPDYKGKPAAATKP